MTPARAAVTVVVEGPTDEPIVRRLLDVARVAVGRVHVSGGKGRLDSRLKAYNLAARHAPWLVLRDLDTDAECAPRFVAAHLMEPSSEMCFRLAVRASEAWLLADREGVAHFLGIPVSHVLEDPESLDDPKRALVDLARRSPHRALREDMVPAKGTSARVGPGYSSRVAEFARQLWRPGVAARHSPSLAGCLRSLRRLVR